jgi:hypothetical protein
MVRIKTCRLTRNPQFGDPVAWLNLTLAQTRPRLHGRIYIIYTIFMLPRCSAIARLPLAYPPERPSRQPRSTQMSCRRARQ